MENDTFWITETKSTGKHNNQELGSTKLLNQSAPEYPISLMALFICKTCVKQKKPTNS